MQALLDKQSKILEKLETIAKQDRLLQLVQTKELFNVDNDGDRLEKQLKNLNDTIKKGLIDVSGNSLNSNVSKLVKIVSDTGKPRSLNKEETKDITDKALGRRQFNTLAPRVDKLKDNIKDFFTTRGFLDKTGIVKRGSGGIISEYLDRGEAKKNYINQRLETQGTTFGTRDTFANQFDEQQRIQYEMRKNEDKIKKLKENGATEAGLGRSGVLKTQTALATDIAKVDPSLRPAGFDTRTGLITDKVTSSDKSSKKNKETISTDSATSDEAIYEQNRMIEEQSDLLKKIEENTRPIKKQSETPQAKPPEPTNESDSGFGVGKLGKSIGSIGGKYLGKVGGIGKLAKGVGIGAVGSLVGGLAQSGGEALQAAGYEQTGKAVSTVGKAGEWAGYGAMAGSFIPGIGTAIGAGIGGLAGLGKGIYDNYFSGSDESAQSEQPSTTTTKKSVPVRGSLINAGGERIPVSIQNEDGSSRLIGYHVDRQGFVPLPETSEADIKDYLESKRQLKASMEARAEGGPIQEGNSYLVGENGPEIIIPSSDGEVVSNEKLKELGEIRAKRKIFSGNNDLVEIGKYTSPEAQAELDKMAARDEKLTSELTAQGIDVNSALAYTGGATESDLMTELLAPTSGDALSKASAQNEAAKMQAMRGQSGNQIVSAPTVNNVNNQNNYVRSSVRNQDSSTSNYINSRYVTP